MYTLDQLRGFVAVAEEGHVGRAPRGHPLTTLGRPPRLADLAEHDVVTYSPSEAWYFYELVVTAFHQARLTPRYVQHISQVHTVLAVVNACLGVALVPRSASALRLENLTFLDVEDVEETPSPCTASGGPPTKTQRWRPSWHGSRRSGADAHSGAWTRPQAVYAPSAATIEAASAVTYPVGKGVRETASRQ
ncbi:LysR substrate-binding domain-containing protein [Actinomycetes bacterium KLBMP 9797]